MFSFTHKHIQNLCDVRKYHLDTNDISFYGVNIIDKDVSVRKKENKSRNENDKDENYKQRENDNDKSLEENARKQKNVRENAGKVVTYETNTVSSFYLNNPLLFNPLGKYYSNPLMTD